MHGERVPTVGHLVGRGHALVKDLLGDGHKCRMGHPGAVVAVADLPLFVRADL